MHEYNAYKVFLKNNLQNFINEIQKNYFINLNNKKCGFV